jgi:hypothetical protein
VSTIDELKRKEVIEANNMNSVKRKEAQDVTV